MIDPRTSVISHRLKKISNIVAVSSGKGGVGKSIVAVSLALALSREGYSVGLFDIDFTSPSTHVILGAKDTKPKEDKGLIPPVVKGLVYMSLVYYSGDLAVPLRGAETSNALIELLAVTRWGKLDFLVIDMPPGIGDAMLDLIRLIENVKFLIVTSPSKLAFETVKKQAKLLKTMSISVLGIVENMTLRASQTISKETEKLGLNYLGEIKYDSSLENTIGNVDELIKTDLWQKVREITLKKILSKTTSGNLRNGEFQRKPNA